MFFVCLIHIVMRFFFQLFWLSTKCQEQSNILEKQNGKRVCVKDEWKCLLLLYIIISLFCLSKCKTNVFTKLIFENSCHTLVRWWCKGIYKILTIGKKIKNKKIKIKKLSTPMFFWNDKWYKYHEITDQIISRTQWWPVRTLHCL